MKQICKDTVTGDKYFICHETSSRPKKEQALCAGKLIIEGRVNKWGNQSTRVARALSIFKGYNRLKGQELIFETIEEAVKHHE